MRYSYHGRILQRIRAGELDRSYYTQDYPRIGAALVLVFRTEPFFRPIRPHRWDEYQKMLDQSKRRQTCDEAVILGKQSTIYTDRGDLNG